MFPAPWSGRSRADTCPDEVEMRQRATILIIFASLSVTALPGCAGPGSTFLRYFYPPDEPPTAKRFPVDLPTDSRPGYWEGTEEAATGADPVVVPNARLVLPFEFEQRSTNLPAGMRLPEYDKVPSVLPPFQFASGSQPSPIMTPAHPVLQASMPPLQENEPLVLAMQCLSNNKPQEAMEHLQRCPAANQEFFMRLLPILAILKDKSIDQLSVSEAAALQEQVQRLLLAVIARSDLVVDKICLCDRIDGYGRFTPKREDYAFKAGTGKQAGELVNVYVEVRNMASVLRDRYYTTLLNGTVRIRDQQGATVWSYNYRKREQPLQSGEPRFDCYRSYDFFVPPMPPGRYTLSIEIVDETCQPHRMAQKSVEFLVAP
jgi:hypothetical protein